MKSIVLQRIKKYIEYKQMSNIDSLANTIGVNYNTLRQQLKGERSLNLDIVIAFVNSFDDLSSDWLLKGQGEMIRSNQMSNVNNFDLSHHNNNASGSGSSINTSESELVSLLKQQNESMAAQITTLTKLVETLASK